MSFAWPELYFIRHGETDWNAEGRYQGSQDIPLNARGRGQADLNGKLLADSFGLTALVLKWFGWSSLPA